MAKNLITNPGYEAGLEGWGNGGTSRSNSGSTVSRDTTQKQAGVASAKVVTPNLLTIEGIDVTTTFAVKAGVTYKVVVFVKGNAGNEKLQVSIGDGTVGSKTKTFTATTSFQKIELEYTPTGSGNTGVAVVTQVKSASTFWVDEWEIFDVSEVSGVEKLVCNTFDLNDHKQAVVEALNFIPAQAKPKFTENPNASGVLLIEEPNFTASYFEAQVRILGANTSDEALAIVGDLMDALQDCARTEEGALLEWTPNNTTTTYTAYAILAELLEVPITPTGDLAGWFLESPVLKIKITCRPFLYTEERLVLAAVESSEQFQTVYVGGIRGDVPAEARAVVRDKATQARNYIEVGQDVVESESNPSIRIKADSLVTTGFAGTKTTKTGSVSTQVVSSTLVSSPVTICSTGSIANVGTYRGKLRVATSNVPVFLRISYRTGEGNTTSRKWAEVPVRLDEIGLSQWQEIDLEELFLDEVERGEQVSEVLIQGYADSKTTVYMDTLSLMPTKRYSVGRGKLNYTESDTITAFDQFNQSSGNLSGKTAEIGGSWSGAGDPDDYTINSTTHTAQRTAVSDVSGTPRYALLGSTTYSDVVVSLDVSANNTQWDEKTVMAVLARYVDTNNWIAFGVKRVLGGGVGVYEGNIYYGVLYKKIGGTKGEISNEFQLSINTLIGTPTKIFSLRLIVLANGEWKIGLGDNILATGIDSDLNASGALKSGKVGMLDERTGATAETRTFDNLEAFVPSVGLVCNAGKAVEINTQNANRESTNGKYWSPIPTYRGSDLYLDPAGQDSLINRLAVKMRRNDINTNVDTTVTDKQSLEVFARERFLTPR